MKPIEVVVQWKHWLQRNIAQWYCKESYIAMIVIHSLTDFGILGTQKNAEFSHGTPPNEFGGQLEQNKIWFLGGSLFHSLAFLTHTKINLSHLSELHILFLPTKGCCRFQDNKWPSRIENLWILATCCMFSCLLLCVCGACLKILLLYY